MSSLHFKRMGRGRVLVLLHGLFGSLDNWQTIGGRLAEEFEVCLVDLRNHGRSAHEPEMTYSLLAGDLLHWLDDQRIEKAWLVGHSMGGKTAMQFSFENPERLHGLLVVDIGPQAYPPWHRGILDALKSLKLEKHTTRQEMDDALASSIQDLRIRQFLLKNVARNERGQFHWRMNLASIDRNYQHLCEAVGNGAVYEGDTLFLSGSESDYVRVSDHDTIKAKFPQALFARIPGAGHWVHADAPEEFLSEALNFLRTRTGISRAKSVLPP